MDDIQTQGKLVSPCISVCQMDAVKGLCLGCYRTREEIAAWLGMSADEQSSAEQIKDEAHRCIENGVG